MAIYARAAAGAQCSPDIGPGYYRFIEGIGPGSAIGDFMEAGPSIGQLLGLQVESPVSYASNWLHLVAVIACP